MNDYTPPVSGLLKLGEPSRPDNGTDYRALGFDTPHVPELIRLLNDHELAFGGSDTPEVYAQVHAWRALGQLRAPEAVPPLLDLLDAQEGDDWSDWVTEEVPVVLGQIGPGIIPAAVARLGQRGQQEHIPYYHANALVEVAKRFPETRTEVIGHLCGVLATAAANAPVLNGFVVSDLVDLGAVEAWPALESAFATGNVDESIAGDAAWVKHKLGLGPPPPPPAASAPAPAQPAKRSGLNAKQRFNERMRKKKAEKKKNKKKGKGG